MLLHISLFMQKGTIRIISEEFSDILIVCRRNYYYPFNSTLIFGYNKGGTVNEILRIEGS